MNVGEEAKFMLGYRFPVGGTKFVVVKPGLPTLEYWKFPLSSIVLNTLPHKTRKKCCVEWHRLGWASRIGMLYLEKTFWVHRLVLATV